MTTVPTASATPRAELWPGGSGHLSHPAKSSPNPNCGYGQLPFPPRENSWLGCSQQTNVQSVLLQMATGIQERATKRGDPTNTLPRPRDSRSRSLSRKQSARAVFSHCMRGQGSPTSSAPPITYALPSRRDRVPPSTPRRASVVTPARRRGKTAGARR